MDSTLISTLLVTFLFLIPLTVVVTFFFIYAYKNSVKEQKERIVFLNDISIALKNIDSSLESITYSTEGIHEKIDDIDSLTIRLKEDDD